MARELSIFVDESGDRGGKARYNMKELDEDEKSFEKLGITFEEKAFCDILVKVRNEHGFPYEEEKYLVLAKAIKEPVDDKAQYAHMTQSAVKSHNGPADRLQSVGGACR